MAAIRALWESIALPKLHAANQAVISVLDGGRHARSLRAITLKSCSHRFSQAGALCKLRGHITMKWVKMQQASQRRYCCSWLMQDALRCLSGFNLYAVCHPAAKHICSQEHL